MQKTDENSWYWRRKSSYLLSELRNFNEIFRKDAIYDNIISHKKTGLDPFSEKHIFGKTTAFLGLKYLFVFCIISYLLCRNCYKIIPCWPMLGQCYLLILPEDIRKFSDIFGVQQIGHWLNVGSCFLYFSLTRIRSVLYGIDF